MMVSIDLAESGQGVPYIVVAREAIPDRAKDLPRRAGLDTVVWQFIASRREMNIPVVS